MVTKRTDQGSAEIETPPIDVESDVGNFAMTAAQASIGGTTGRYLVLLDPKEVNSAERQLSSQASISLDSVASGDETPIGLKSIAEGRGLMFPELGVMVINPGDDLASVNAAVAASSEMQVIEPERFVYANADFDVSYLRGFRDAVDHLYKRLTEPAALSGGIAIALSDESQFSWGLQATQVSNSQWTGRGVRIAILDTGIDLAHPDFQGRAILHRSFIAGQTVDDGHGHGTHCAGVACGPLQPRSLPRFGIAHEADLLVGKVLADSGRGTDASIIAGIQWAISEKADVISMSLGGRVSPQQNYSRIFQQIAERAIREGSLIVAAAGNDSSRTEGRLEPVSHPANCPAIFAVGALDRNLRVARFSNAGLNRDGGKVDIAAPGVDIRSTWPGAEQYKSLEGTSMATPHVAGIAALYAQQSRQRGHSLWARLVQQALPMDLPARDVGAGLARAPQ